MNIIYTLIVIVSLYFLGTGISSVIAPIIIIPGNLIGMGLLYIGLTLKWVNIDRIKETGDYLLKHMSLFFIPFGVSVVSYYDLIKMDLISILLIVVVSTVVAMLVTAKVIDKAMEGR